MIEINNLTANPIDEEFLKKVAKRILKEDKGKEKKDLSIALVEPNKIKRLSKRYRKRDRITDTLSFTYNNHFGEIVICPEVVKKNAKRFNSDFKKELTRVLIHGILHLLGYDHENSKRESKKMEKKENYYLNLIFK